MWRPMARAAGGRRRAVGGVRRGAPVSGHTRPWLGTVETYKRDGMHACDDIHVVSVCI